MRKKMTLTKRLTILVVIIFLVPILLIESVFIYVVTDVVKRQEIDNLEDTANLVSANLENTMESVFLQFVFTYQDATVNEISRQFAGARLDEIEALSLSFTLATEEVAKLNRIYRMDMRVYYAMARKDGVVIANTRYDSSRLAQVALLAQEKVDYTVDTVTVVGAMPSWDSYSTNENMIVLAKNMNYPDTEIMFYMAVPETTLRHIMLGENYSDNDIYLIDKERKILSGRMEELIQEDIQTVAYFPDNISKRQIYENLGTPDGRALAVYQTMNNMPFSVVVLEPYESFLSQLWDILWQMLLTTVVFAGIFLIIAIYIVRINMRPIEKLSYQMENGMLQEVPEVAETIPKGASSEVESLYHAYCQLQHRIVQLVSQVKQQEKKKRLQEFALLQAQMKPHFLFNSLMSIRCAISNHNIENAEKMILALSSFMRNVIVRPDEVITLRQEVENLQNYIQLQNLRSNAQIRFEVHIPETLSDYKVPKLLLQPFVENSIIHGFKFQKSGVIEMTAEIIDGSIFLFLHDNGAGYEEDPLSLLQNTEENHYGVRNVNERIKLYYGSSYQIRYKKENGTTVILELPGAERANNVSCLDCG